MSCALCQPASGQVLWKNPHCCIILADEPAFPGLCRIVWRTHVREMTDLTGAERTHFMAVVFAAEGVLRELMTPDKINLASLGNQTPHLHWHVIPRFTDDSHFPDSIWARQRRQPPARPVDAPRLR